ncbi:sigma-70 family RNA polymerase sigma factor [Lactobacillus sp. PV034]|uniref:sigma-70 family RNA polymerase sigma factor n=1 Tax=Lactobacillus sp. PV034 TaxID=2594495 RepID=UPI002240596B|nr:sigma-70 family RNA polymerase sigma factor [Lactobacillus sp. PV034]QNQ81403.1 sigma-70 family RNA polymerase sigma factor [Lactobacillus sp. PV034]
MEKKNEYDLIIGVKNKNDEDLRELMQRYMPLVNSIKKRYYIRHYDSDDWDQDAMMICYETCCLFDFKLNKSFGAFYKTKLSNHARSLLRYELAKRREPYRKAISYEVATTNGMVNEESRELSITPEREIYQKYLTNLSKLELIATLFLLGMMTQKQACSLAQCSYMQLLQAKGRCKKKLTQELK